MSRTIIDKLRRMAIFVTVVDQGSFRAAARKLGMAASGVSQSVSDLERDLGVILLLRSTRRMSLTKGGEALLREARVMLSSAERGFDAVNVISDEPAGDLAVSLPAFITAAPLMEMIAQFSLRYPKIALDLHFSDRPSDLVKEGYDVAIRAGFLEYNEASARNIGHQERCLVASKSYADAKPAPSHPSDLEDWDWLNFKMRSDKITLLKDSGESADVVGRSNMKVSSIHALHELTLRGLGLTILPDDLAAKGLEDGILVRILPEWNVQPLGIHALWAYQPNRKNLIAIFVDFLADSSPIPHSPEA